MIKKSFPFVLLLCLGFILSPQFVSAARTDPSDRLWSEVKDSSLRASEAASSVNEYKVFRLDKSLLRSILQKAPLEYSAPLSDSFADKADEDSIIITLPLPDGTFSRFVIKESPIMEAGLAKKYPSIATYIGQGIDNRQAVARMSLSAAGFRAMILAPGGTIVVDPLAKGDTENYISFDKADAERDGSFVCEFNNELAKLGSPGYESITGLEFPASFVSNGAVLRTYRLALAATAEYTNVFRQTGDTDLQAKARAIEQQVIVMNRVNGIFERDFAVRMILIANNDSIIYTDSAADPYNNSDSNVILGQNQTNLDSVIGTANYDIGHVFSTGSGGRATLRSPCTTLKARGTTGKTNPIGDPFSIDYVAHEMGHQFGGSHTFNAGTPERSGSAAYEPGSGITIMGYAGIVTGQNLARNSIDTFHVRSLEEIVAFISNPATGGACGVSLETGNAAPTISAAGGAFYNIPKQTPFSLSATASDANGDAVTYDWQQYDLGGATNAVPNTDSDGTARPLFRSYPPKTDGNRIFPSLQYILNNANVPPSTTPSGSAMLLTGELLPSISRTMNFQVIARDNRAGGGGINTTTVQVAVDGNSGPFVITSPNGATTFGGNTSQTITWDVANTTAAPINAANVRISLSTDGGQTFPTILAETTANDGSEAVTIPNAATAAARIKIEAINNIFFDISNANFSITAAAPRIEADTSPRPNGDGIINSGDITQIRRFVLGLDVPAANEFQKADSAPLNTLGDGSINSGDVSQARRYALGLDSPQISAGRAELFSENEIFDAQIKNNISASTKASDVRIARHDLIGNTLTVAILFNSEHGKSKANAISASINYDKKVLSNPTNIRLGNGAPTSASLGYNLKLEQNSIGLLLDLAPADTFPAGLSELVLIDFTIISSMREVIAISFSDAPTAKYVSDTNGNALPAMFTEVTNLIAPAKIKGRIVTADGRTIFRAKVSITDQNGATEYAFTNPFGYYLFDDVKAGETYKTIAVPKQYEFNERVISIGENLGEINFNAAESLLNFNNRILR